MSIHYVVGYHSLASKEFYAIAEDSLYGSTDTRKHRQFRTLREARVFLKEKETNNFFGGTTPMIVAIETEDEPAPEMTLAELEQLKQEIIRELSQQMDEMLRSRYFAS